jgi:alcohol dehydrogenase class IV
MENYSPHQQKIIKRYYDNIDQVSWQRLAELVADLYLAEGKKRDKMWASADSFMEKLKVPQAKRDAIVQKKDVEALAKLVKELMGKE